MYEVSIGVIIWLERIIFLHYLRPWDQSQCRRTPVCLHKTSVDVDWLSCRQFYLVVVAVRILWVRRRSVEYLCPPSQATSTEGHVGDTEAEREADCEGEDEMFWKELMTCN